MMKYKPNVSLIKQNYKRLYHPDRNPLTNDAVLTFKTIT